VRIVGAAMVLVSVAVLSQLSGRDPVAQVTEPH